MFMYEHAEKIVTLNVNINCYLTRFSLGSFLIIKKSSIGTSGLLLKFEKSTIWLVVVCHSGKSAENAFNFLCKETAKDTQNNICEKLNLGFCLAKCNTTMKSYLKREKSFRKLEIIYLFVSSF